MYIEKYKTLLKENKKYLDKLKAVIFMNVKTIL